MERMSKTGARTMAWLGARDHRGALGLILLMTVVMLQGLLQLVA